MIYGSETSQLLGLPVVTDSVSANLHVKVIPIPYSIQILQLSLFHVCEPVWPSCKALGWSAEGPWFDSGLWTLSRGSVLHI